VLALVKGGKIALETPLRLEAGLDWFSATLPCGHPESGQVYHVAFDLSELIFNEGNKAAEIMKLGYRGIQSGKFFIGESDQGLLIVATGSEAMRAYQHLYISEMHVSRLDLQVTVWNPQDGRATGVLAEANARDYKKRGGKGNNRQIRHIADDGDGYTLYIGSRNSTSFMRLYNKGSESKDEYYEGSWRYEVETHNIVATEAARQLSLATVSIEQSIVATVAAYSRDRGLFVPWSAEASLSVLRPLPSIETDDLRSLRWLSAQVRPTVQRLLRAGYSADVAQALGLDQD